MNKREKAEEIFAWGKEQRTDEMRDSWLLHLRSAAKVASVIAERIQLDADLAYAMGLMHDIGRCDFEAGMNHIMIGYRKMMAEGLPEIARTCLTHSFGLKEQVETLELDTVEDTEFVKKYIREIEYDDYDRLIQLADYMSGAHGVTTLERRFCSVLARYDLAEPRRDLMGAYKLKRYFDEKCGVDVYELFREEIAESPFRGIPGDYEASLAPGVYTKREEAQ